MYKCEPYSILIIENDIIFQNIIKERIYDGNKNHKVRIASNGTNAIEIINENSSALNIIITEINLPDISGIDLIKSIRKSYPNLQFIVLTSNEQEDIFLSAIRSGVHGYLLKDDIEKSLAGALEQVMTDQYPISLSFCKYFFKMAGSPISTDRANKYKISPREHELLKLIADGKSYIDCANLMNVSLSTVQTHIRNLYRKMDITNQRQAIKIAHASGLLNY